MIERLKFKHGLKRPLLLTIEDSNGRQAAAYWREYSNSTSVAKEKEPEEE